MNPAMGLWSKLTGGADRQTFVDEALARIRQALGAAELDAATFSVRFDGGTVFLENYWHEYREANAKHRGRVIDRIVDGAREMMDAGPETFAGIRARLRPMVHDQLYWSASRLKFRIAKVPPDQLPHVAPFDAHLTLSVVVDHPTMRRGVTPTDHETWGKDFAALLAEAKGNLERASHTSWKAVAPGVWRLPFDDGYAVSRLVLPALFREVTGSQRPVALALNADVVLAAAPERAGALATLATLGEEVFTLTKSMMPVPLVLDADRWVEYPLDESATRAAFDELRYRFLIDAYEGQQSMLNALGGGDASDTFVASYKVGQKQGGPLTSMASLTIGLPTLLPKCDRVVIVKPGPTRDDYKVLCDVAWDAFARVVPLTEEPDLVPARYRTDGALDDAQCQALASA
jgi:hypothetical protein